MPSAAVPGADIANHPNVAWIINHLDVVSATIEPFSAARNCMLYRLTIYVRDVNLYRELRAPANQYHSQLREIIVRSAKHGGQVRRIGLVHWITGCAAWNAGAP